MISELKKNFKNQVVTSVILDKLKLNRLQLHIIQFLGYNYSRSQSHTPQIIGTYEVSNQTVNM